MANGSAEGTQPSGPGKARKRQIEFESKLTDEQALDAFQPIAESEGGIVSDLQIAERRPSHVALMDVFVFSWTAHPRS